MNAGFRCSRSRISWLALNDVHERILEAIAARDEDRAAGIMAEHFDVIAKILAKHQGHGRLSSIAFRPRGPKQPG